MTSIKIFYEGTVDNERNKSEIDANCEVNASTTSAANLFCFSTSLNRVTGESFFLKREAESGGIKDKEYKRQQRELKANYKHVMKKFLQVNKEFAKKNAMRVRKYGEPQEDDIFESNYFRRGEIKESADKIEQDCMVPDFPENPTELPRDPGALAVSTLPLFDCSLDSSDDDGDEKYSLEGITNVKSSKKIDSIMKKKISINDVVEKQTTKKAKEQKAVANKKQKKAVAAKKQKKAVAAKKQKVMVDKKKKKAIADKNQKAVDFIKKRKTVGLKKKQLSADLKKKNSSGLKKVYL